MFYSIIKQHPWGLVGYFRRQYTGNPKLGNLKYIITSSYPYHFILTGATFLHRLHLHLFTEHLPPVIFKLVDEKMNCKDVAMNFVVSHRCRCSGIFFVKIRKRVREPKKSLSMNNGGLALSFRKTHHGQRSQCLNVFARQFHEFPIKPSWCAY